MRKRLTASVLGEVIEHSFSTVEGDLKATLANLEELVFGFTSIGSRLDESSMKIHFYLEDSFGIDFGDPNDVEKYENGEREAANFARDVAKPQIEEAFPGWIVLVPSSWISRFGVKAGRRKEPSKDGKTTKKESKQGDSKKTKSSKDDETMSSLLESKVSKNGKIIFTGVGMDTPFGEISKKDLEKICSMLNPEEKSKK